MSSGCFFIKDVSKAFFMLKCLEKNEESAKMPANVAASDFLDAEKISFAWA